MRKILPYALAAVMGLPGVVGMSSRAMAAGDEENESGHQHQPVTLDQLPTGVQSTLQEEARGGQIEELSKEIGANGSVTYEAEVVKGSTGTDLEIAPDGRVLERRSHNENAEEQMGGEAGERGERGE